MTHYRSKFPYAPLSSTKSDVQLSAEIQKMIKEKGLEEDWNIKLHSIQDFKNGNKLPIYSPATKLNSQSRYSLKNQDSFKIIFKNTWNLVSQLCQITFEENPKSQDPASKIKTEQPSKPKFVSQFHDIPLNEFQEQLRYPVHKFSSKFVSPQQAVIRNNRFSSQAKHNGTKRLRKKKAASTQNIMARSPQLKPLHVIEEQLKSLAFEAQILKGISYRESSNPSLLDELQPKLKEKIEFPRYEQQKKERGHQHQLSPLVQQSDWKTMVSKARQSKKKSENAYGNFFLNEKFPKDSEFQEKYMQLRGYYNLANLQNNLFVQIPSGGTYKAYVANGNNGQMVKFIVKSRWWWQVVDKSEYESANLIWTQIGKDKTFALLPGKDKPQKQRMQQALQRRKRVLTLEDANELLPVDVIEDPQGGRFHNHVEKSDCLGEKKNLFYNLQRYYASREKSVWEVIPRTFHVEKDNREYESFVQYSSQLPDQVWIIKPGEHSNRGHGIILCSNATEVKQLTSHTSFHKNGQLKTYILQEYITRPLLVFNRKFDIRCFLLFTSINGHHKGYWYEEGYLRTSSKEFQINNLSNKFIHLTNDAVQKKSDEYGKFEKSNKLSYEDLQKILGDSIDFKAKLLPQMKEIGRDLLISVKNQIDPNRKQYGFELFGLDFMIDQDYKIWLIEANTNPCLEQSGVLLSRLIPCLIENIFRLVIDPVLQPPHFYSIKKLPYEIEKMSKFEQIFDESLD